MPDTSTSQLTTTFDRGGSTTRTAQITVTPGRARDTASFAAFAGGQLNAPFLADFLSAVLMHARCGRHLFRSVAGRTRNPMLQRRYARLAEQAERTIGRLVELTIRLGGEPGYVSPSARATEKLDQGAVEATFLLDGSLDVIAHELVMLDAVVLALTIDDANWGQLAEIGSELDGAAHDALATVVEAVQPGVAENHLWALQARRRIVSMQATHPGVAGVQASAETALGWFRGLFADDRD